MFLLSTSSSSASKIIIYFDGVRWSWKLYACKRAIVCIISQKWKSLMQLCAGVFVSLSTSVYTIRFVYKWKSLRTFTPWYVRACVYVLLFTWYECNYLALCHSQTRKFCEPSSFSLSFSSFVSPFNWMLCYTFQTKEFNDCSVFMSWNISFPRFVSCKNSKHTLKYSRYKHTNCTQFRICPMDLKNRGKHTKCNSTFYSF